MSRVTHVSVAALLIVATVATVVGAGALGPGHDRTTANASATLPGAQYAGVVGAQEAEVEAEHRGVAFDIRLADATTNAAAAAVIDGEVAAIRDRLARLETRQRAQANASDEEDGAREAQAATRVAHRVALERHVLRVERAASGLPAPLRERYGITDATFRSLLDRVDALTTPEMDEVARDIAGEEVGEALDEEEAETDEDDETESEGDGDGADGDGEGTGDDGEASDGEDTESAEGGDGDGAGSTATPRAGEGDGDGGEPTETGASGDADGGEDAD